MEEVAPTGQASQQRARLPSRSARCVAPALSLLSTLLLSGCAGFFVSPTSTTTTPSTTPTPSNSGDYAYTANSSAGSTSLSEYNVSGGSLTSVGTVNLGYVPVALAVAPSNQFLYAASAPGSTTPGVYVYSIALGGALTVANGGNVPATDTVAALAISPDGNWLFTVNSSGFTMNEYSVNTTTGQLTLRSTLSLPGVSCTLGGTPVSQNCSVAVSPSGQYVVAALGTAGDAVFNYSSAAGITGSNGTIASGFSTTNFTGDFSVVLDANNYAYIARTDSVGIYAIGSTVTDEGTLNYTPGLVPRGITLNKTYNYLFTANEGPGTISALSIGANGALKTVGSPVIGPANVSALGVDNTGLYMVAVGYDASAGVRLYSLSSSGVLAQVAAQASGTNTVLPALVAMTH